jgi:hypothetical protein
MANSYAIATSVVAGRNRVYDAVLPFGITLSTMTISSDVDQQWDIFLDQQINNLTLPVQPALTAATTGGTIALNTKLYVRITTIVADATQPDGYLEGQPCVSGKTVTVGATTSTNKVTVAITAVTGASGYRIYVGTSPGYEAFSGQILGSTSYIITSLPADATRGVPTMPDISIKLAAGVSQTLPVGGQSVYVGAKVTVFCTVGGTTSGTAYFSMIGA